MKYLLDTHILIWMAVSPEKISKSILEIMENTENKIYVSTISLLEIAIKMSIGKLNLRGLEISDLIESCVEENIEIIQLSPSAIVRYRKLPIKENHKDPFDRTLISICMADDLVLLSMDSKFGQYKKDGLGLIT